MPHTEPHSPRPNSKNSGRTDQLSAGPANLFAYGTLQFPDVLTALLGRVPLLTPATATGWRAAALPERVYPLLVPGTSSASGVTITDLTATEWRIIDAFEDDIYQLDQITLTNGQHAWAYLSHKSTQALPEDWSADLFATHHLTAYTTRCATWRRHHDQATRTDRQPDR